MYPFALSDSEEICAFDVSSNLGAHVVSGDPSTLLPNDNYQHIRCKTIDKLICGKIDLLALDVEGLEINALIGAKHVIHKFSPILGICVYHKIGHYTDIPLCIKEINPSYQILVRHHSISPCESVIYAINN